MATINAIKRPPRKTWTVADLYRRFGPIAFERIRQDPPPGSGTVDDVNRLNDHEDRLYELVDGILVEKTVGLEESVIAGNILTILNIFVKPRGLGLVAGEAGTIQLDINLVRIPDVAFFSMERCRAARSPRSRFPSSFPTWPLRSSAGATPPRRWGKSSRNISRTESAWSGSFGRGAGSSTSTRRRTTLPG